MIGVVRLILAERAVITFQHFEMSAFALKLCVDLLSPRDTFMLHSTYIITCSGTGLIVTEPAPSNYMNL